MPAPFGSYQPGSPGRAPTLSAEFGPQYTIYGNDFEKYKAGQYFSPDVTQYTIVFAVFLNPLEADERDQVTRSFRLNFTPGTPLANIEKKMREIIKLMRAAFAAGTQFSP